MKKVTIYTILTMLSMLVLFGCDSSTTGITNEKEKTRSQQSVLMKSQRNVASFVNMYKSTGELRALWEGCEDGHEGPGVFNEDCPDDDEIDCPDGFFSNEHDNGCKGARPAREFYLDFNAHLMREEAKGKVVFEGIGDYEGIDFKGSVSWVEVGRESNELFFGGKIKTGSVDRECFLFSMQDNGEGKNAESDRMQYRLYGASHSPCHIPGHLPKGYPIAVYSGNLQVH